MQKHANIVDLVKSVPTNIFLQNLVSIQPRTSPPKICKKLQNLNSAKLDLVILLILLILLRRCTDPLAVGSVGVGEAGIVAVAPADGKVVIADAGESQS